MTEFLSEGSAHTDGPTWIDWPKGRVVVTYRPVKMFIRHDPDEVDLVNVT